MQLIGFNNCYVVKAKRNDVWMLKAIDDNTNEEYDLAIGNLPDELLIWAELQGFTLSENPVKT